MRIPMLTRRLLICGAVLGFVLMCLSATAVAQVNVNGNGKRLIMKDGTYQPATQWEVKGDRVRYYSTERGEWEEVPKGMVDWEATKKWDAERATLEDARIKEETADEKESPSDQKQRQSKRSKAA